MSHCPAAKAPIVFLHLPKTAGQTIHAALSRAVGPKATSPTRHPKAGEQQFPAGFALYSGHLDWAAYPATGARPFAFTVLRDPQERLASFYLYLRRRALALDPAQSAGPDTIGLRRILQLSPAAYFAKARPHGSDSSAITMPTPFAPIWRRGGFAAMRGLPACLRGICCAAHLRGRADWAAFTIAPILPPLRAIWQQRQGLRSHFRRA